MHQSLITIDPRAERWRDHLLRSIYYPREHRRRRRRDQAGLTLLEIMIVMAIMALIMGLVVGPIVMRQFGTARRDVAKAMVQKYVNEAYPMWAQSNPDKVCPSNIAELGEHTNARNSKDPWGQPYRLYCGATLPAGAAGIAVASNGPDQKEGSEDDVRSWE